MPEIKKLMSMPSYPGVQRDGTLSSANFFTDSQWCRFQRGLPRKIGGYVQITNLLSGPIRSQLVWSKGQTNALYCFSPSAIELLIMDSSGAGSNIYTLTPSGFTTNTDYVWSADTLWDAAAGGGNTIVVAVANSTLAQIDDNTAKQVYFGIAGVTANIFTAISGLTVSGGVCAVAPYLVYYGANGLVGWSDANQPQTLYTGDANTARVTGAKIVKALAMRGGSGPSALLWSLDSLIKMDWVGGPSIFRFTTVTAQSSIMGQNSVVEYDGSFYWVGVDRFLQYSGGQVSEIPNTQNLNWFYDNLNYTHRQKVWGMKVPRFGEIWWFFPMGTATECDHAVILNLREKTWYDVTLARSAGFYSQVFHLPVMATAAADPHVRSIVITITSGTFNVGNVVHGTTSNASGTITSLIDSTHPIVYLTVADTNFTALEGLTNLSVAGVGTVTSQKTVVAAYTHERGYNAVAGDVQNPIDSYFETCDFGFPTGSGNKDLNSGPNNWTRLVRIEPDFVQAGPMTVQVMGREWAQGPDTASDEYSFNSDTPHVDMREQRREMRLKFRSNAIDGNFETGNVLLHVELGDLRS